jgi:acetyl esterase
MEPPTEGCPLCGSTWGDWWADVQGQRRFFCCELCARQWLALLAEVRRHTGWARVDAVDVEGNRWGRTCIARGAGADFHCFVVFTPEGELRRFEVLPEGPAAPAPLAAAPVAPIPAAPTADFEEVPDLENGGGSGDGPAAVPPAPEVPTVEAPTVEAPTDETPAAEDAAEGPLPVGTIPAEIVEQLEHEKKEYPDLTAVSVEEGRKAVREMARETDGLAGPTPAVALIKNTSIATGDHRIPVRVYTPKEGDPPLPAVLFLHGGGWAFGDLDTADHLCREIANRSRSVVLSIAYRRSPEHKFPAALEDAYSALTWVTERAVAERLALDPDRIAVVGESAGANLAAVVAQLAKERGGPKVAAQVLLCPVTAVEPDTPSYRENATGTGLEPSFLTWMWAQYLRSPEDAKDPHVAPLLATDLAGLPPALILTAEFDVLRDEGEQYGQRLNEAGVPTQVTRYPGMVHGFVDYRGLAEAGWQALDEIGEMLRTRLGT